MPSTPRQKYELELWINGVQVGDISRLARNRSFQLRRNLSEQLSFSMDLTAFERYCTSAGRSPEAMLEPYVTDIRVKLNGQYLFGVEVSDILYNLGVDGISVEVKSAGFLDLFKDRYITKKYPDTTESTDIVRDALDITQTESGDPSDDFGVLPGVVQETVGVPREREYINQNVRDLIVNLTDLVDGNFDVKFNYDRTYEIYQQQGSNRPGKKFTYPYNITSGSVPRTAMNLYNYIIGLGSGFGEETIQSIKPDPVSRGNYKTRQKIVTFNSVILEETLEQNTEAFLKRFKDILILPKIKVAGEFCDLNIIGIGDRIPIEVQGHTSIPLDDTYRIEQIDVRLDDNDAEDIDLTVDNYGL